MEKISRTVYPTETLDINSWFKEFRVGLIAERPSMQAKDMMALWQDKEGRKNDFKTVIESLMVAE